MLHFSHDIWFVADLHLGQPGYIDLFGRPYANVRAMDEELVTNWNAVVGRRDEVYVLGDVAAERQVHLLRLLKGTKRLVPGNHDTRHLATIARHMEILPELASLRVDKVYSFALCHYPLEAWDHERHRYHLHGHSHGRGRALKQRLDVGIDATQRFRPVNLDEIKVLLSPARRTPDGPAAFAAVPDSC